MNEKQIAFGSILIPIYCNYNICDKVDVKYARTLLCRDYKGFGTSSETSNAVCIIRKLCQN